MRHHGRLIHVRQHRRKRLSAAPVLGALGLLFVIGTLAWAVFSDDKTGSETRSVGTYVAPPAERLSLWVGDSYTAGTGADNEGRAESCLTAIELNTKCILDAQGGTGFLADGKTNSKAFERLGPRIASQRARYGTPELIIVDAGRNDGEKLTSEYRRSARSAYDELTKVWPRARVVLVAPYYMTSQPDSFKAVRAWMKRQAAGRGWGFVDPIGEGWINAASANLTNADRVHPNPAGHAYIANHLAPQIRRALATVG